MAIAIDLRFSLLERGSETASFCMMTTISAYKFDEQALKYKEAYEVI